MLSPALDKTLRRALIEAEKTMSAYLTLEHLLLALMEDEDAAAALKKKEIALEDLQQELREFLKSGAVPTVEMSELSPPPSPTLAFQRVIQRAIVRMQAESAKTVSGTDLLLSLFSEKESFAVYALMKRNFSRLELIEASGRKSFSGAPKNAPHIPRHPFQDPEELNEEMEENPLQLYCRNLTEEAHQGKLDPLIGREKELFRTVQILCRRHKNNPLLVGHPGVGKTAIAEGLATRIVSGDIPAPLAKKEIFALNTGALIAGTRYRGDFEERISALLEALEDSPNALLFVDEAHILMGAGSSSGSGTDAANLLKPALANGKLRCIAATTYQEYRLSFERDPALGRRFQKIDVEEPSEAETLKILEGLKPKLEAFHKVRYGQDALESAVTLSVRHLHQRKLPDKAIDLLDEAGAASRLITRKKSKKTPELISTRQIEDVLAIMANIPVPRLRRNEATRFRQLRAGLEKNIFGQQEAIETLLSAVVLSRSGLREKDKPIGAYLFSGPTGVGKTALAKQLAESMDVPLIRFDMSEYRESHSASRLIGAPPGYVGFETGGALTEKISQNPHSVLLLDEIEKAHPDLFNLLLQVMDYGKLTDRNGKTVDFSNVALIMTTNEGAESLTKESIGFLSKLPDSDAENESLKRLFTPEFRNRLDAIVPFRLISKETLRHIAQKLLSELKDELAAKDITLHIAPALAEWLAKKSYDVEMGARPLAKNIQKDLKLPLAKAMAFGELAAGQAASISLKEDENGKKIPDFSFSALPAKKPSSKKVSEKRAPVAKTKPPKPSKAKAAAKAAPKKEKTSKKSS